MDTRMSARDLYERGRMLRQAKMYDRALADFRSAIQDPNYAGKAHTQVALCFRAMVNVYESGAFGFSVSPNPLNCLRRYSRITSMFAWTWGSSSIRSSLLWPFVIVIASPNRALLWFDICQANIERLHPATLLILLI